MRDYLKTLRNEKNFSQQEVADKLGVSLSYYNLIENGERQKDISLAMLSKFALALKIPLTKIIKLEEEYQASLNNESIAK